LVQIFFSKINLSKKIYYKRHLLRLIRILANENILFISIWDPTIPKKILTQKLSVGNMLSWFPTTEVGIWCL
jgi:hypothetical protein